MKQPTSLQFHSYASDIACDRPNVRHWLIVSNFLYSIDWRRSRAIIMWLSEMHPGFRDRVAAALPRLDPRAFV